MEYSAKNSCQRSNKRSSGSFFGSRRRSTFFSSAFIQPKLKIGAADDPYEREADAAADKVMRMRDTEILQTNISQINVQRKCAGCEEEGKKVQLKGEGSAGGTITAPSSVDHVVNSAGQPLEAGTRTFMESRFGYDFGNVQVHNDSSAHRSSAEINALAYTHDNHIAFGSGQYRPETDTGKQLSAHELAHVIQQDKFVRPYRTLPSKDKTKGKRLSFNFGKWDSSTLVEDEFDMSKDKDTKPWIELITVEFKTKKTDVNGSNYWEGIANVKYYDNPFKKPDYSFTVAGGSAELGKTDKGNFIVRRIEGIGYNSGSFSGSAGIDYDASNREGPRKRYSKDLSANMSFAVFYNGGEALHGGPLDQSSHGCVHVDFSDIQQLNYHSVIGYTKVKVTYP